MNQRLAERRRRARHLKQWKEVAVYEKAKANLPKLAASTIRAAKAQAKRFFPQGCLIRGYHLVTNIDLTGNAETYPECFYECGILPANMKQPGGRKAFSNREELYQQHHGIKGPPIGWIKPEWFEVELYN